MIFSVIGMTLLIVAAFIILMILVQMESNLLGVVWLTSTAVLLHFCGYNTLSWIQQNPLLLLLGFVCYVVLGAGWSIIKWTLFVKDRKASFVENRFRLRRDGTRSQIPMHIPDPHDEKYRILSWMAWWPVSIINAILFDAIKQIFEAIFRRLYKLLNTITNSIYKDIVEETKEEK